ncbi:hypothetical protein ABZO31_03425 [Streptomyces sp. HUAS MG47]|uniref:hypothetical protein n=1 Tax=Streptomyces solicamelliae TaxID=3231716 RepID=UPI00387838E9
MTDGTDRRSALTALRYLELTLDGDRRARRQLERRPRDLAFGLAHVGLMAVDVVALPALAERPNPRREEWLLRVREIFRTRCRVAARVAPVLQTRMLSRLVLRVILPPGAGRREGAQVIRSLADL